ncbi:glycosyltransferase [Pedobacter sp. KACC 23697]|uniref:Glycosyltransferase n=1 Tax=Pedobacter sp. KACC 23697 TaxID=3149230 RepID=A0AAU7K2K1_9SPHI
MGESLRTKVVISAVNFTSGGPLSVLIDCLTALLKYDHLDQFEVTVLVHRKELVSQFIKHFHIVEYPEVKSSWLKRLNFEYRKSKVLSEEINPKIWISLHDMTPNVTAEVQYVYCHNPAPFYSVTAKEISLDFKFFLFNQFYKYLYGINIKQNKFIIVQQEWLRARFEKIYNVKTIVAYPNLQEVGEFSYKKEIVKNGTFVFFFPSFPRVFKNFEVILEAAALLQKNRQDFKVIITLDGKENKYSKMLYAKYSKYESIDFIGKLDRNEVFVNYDNADCLIFPSKLETWGLPISEFKPYNKPILLADLPYAHETVGRYEKVSFFNPDDADSLSVLMDKLIDGKLEFEGNSIDTPKAPFFINWDGLVSFLLGKN